MGEPSFRPESGGRGNQQDFRQPRGPPGRWRAERRPVASGRGSSISFSTIGAAQAITCGISQDRKVHCWDALVGPVAGIDDAVAVSASCAVLTCGSVACWQGMTPGGISDAAAVVDGDGGQRFAISKDGTLRGWGTNYMGQLGNGSASSSNSATPVLTRLTSKASALSTASPTPSPRCSLLPVRALSFARTRPRSPRAIPRTTSNWLPGPAARRRTAPAPRSPGRSGRRGPCARWAGGRSRGPG